MTRNFIRLTMLLLSLQTISYAAQEVNTSLSHEDLIKNIIKMYPQYVEGFQVLGLGDHAFEDFLYENISNYEVENEDEEAHGGEVLESAMDTIKNGIQGTFMKALQKNNPNFVHDFNPEDIHTMADLSPLTPLDSMKNLADPKIRYVMKYSGYNPDDKARPFMLPQIKEWIREWLINTPDIGRRTGSSETLLCKAVRNGYLEQMKLLISAGADINAQDNDGDTALHCAIDSRYFIGTGKSVAAIKILVAGGAKINSKGLNNRTPLMNAVLGSNFAIVKILLAADANPNIQDGSGETALFLAIANYNLPIIEILLAAQADPNIKNRYGYTVLFYAKNIPEIKMLLDAGADPSIRDDHFNKTPVDVASSREVYDLLMQYGAGSHK